MYTCMPKESSRSHNGYEPLCGCWKLNSGPLEEQPVFLTSEPSVHLQPALFPFLRKTLTIYPWLTLNS